MWPAWWGPQELMQPEKFRSISPMSCSSSRSWKRSVIAYGAQIRPSRTEIIAAFPYELVNGSSGINWYAISGFKGKERCPETCWDFSTAATSDL